MPTQRTRATRPSRAPPPPPCIKQNGEATPLPKTREFTRDFWLEVRPRNRVQQYPERVSTMTKKRTASKSTPMCNARLELAWIQGEDTLGSTCFFTRDDGKRDYIDCWLSSIEVAGPAIVERALDLGDAKKLHFSLTRDEVEEIAERFASNGSLLAAGEHEGVPTAIRRLAATGAFAVANEVRNLLFVNGRKAFSGKTAIRLTVFAPKS